jgi:hypothetical protein
MEGFCLRSCVEIVAMFLPGASAFNGFGARRDGENEFGFAQLSSQAKPYCALARIFRCIGHLRSL